MLSLVNGYSKLNYEDKSSTQFRTNNFGNQKTQGNLIEVSKIYKGYGNISSEIFFSVIIGHMQLMDIQ